jgi:hypothetical protein
VLRRSFVRWLRKSSGRTKWPSRCTAGCRLRPISSSLLGSGQGKPRQTARAAAGDVPRRTRVVQSCPRFQGVLRHAVSPAVSWPRQSSPTGYGPPWFRHGRVLEDTTRHGWASSTCDGSGRGRTGWTRAVHWELLPNKKAQKTGNGPKADLLLVGFRISCAGRVTTPCTSSEASRAAGQQETGESSPARAGERPGKTEDDAACLSQLGNQEGTQGHELVGESAAAANGLDCPDSPIKVLLRRPQQLDGPPRSRREKGGGGKGLAQDRSQAFARVWRSAPQGGHRQAGQAGSLAPGLPALAWLGLASPRAGGA